MNRGMLRTDRSYDDGVTALHFACWGGNKELVEIVLKHNSSSSSARSGGSNRRGVALYNLVSSSGDTALHWCARSGNWEVAQALIARGASTNITNADGLTFRFLATQPPYLASGATSDDAAAYRPPLVSPAPVVEDDGGWGDVFSTSAQKNKLAAEQKQNGAISDSCGIDTIDLAELTHGRSVHVSVKSLDRLCVCVVLSLDYLASKQQLHSPRLKGSCVSISIPCGHFVCG